MSGGVDSSVAAALLHEQGYEVLGVTLQLWGKDVCASTGTKLCCSVRDTLDAKAVAKRLGITHHVLELADSFRTNVIDYFVDSYEQGLTPNPCIACNDHMKFGELMEYADSQGAAFVATGHYARIGFDAVSGRATLRRAADASKDQSYVLFNLTQAQLAKARCPLGELTKPQVRAIAGALGFVTAQKADSQDVCFVRDRNKDGFLRKELGVGDQPGPITDLDGKVLGTHRGLLGYTIGQREGLGLALSHPVYVIAMDQPNNRLIVGPREALLRDSLIAERVNWVSIAAVDSIRHAQVKIRSRHEPAPARLVAQSDRTVRVEFETPQPAVTPGQATVFYDGDVVLGGGWIGVDEPAAGYAQPSARASAEV